MGSEPGDSIASIRGVYAVGHTAITRQGRWMGAVLASGHGAVLSHQSATALWGIWGSGAGETHVTVPRKTRSQRSIRRHFSMLPDDERTVLAGIPTTSAARAVLDLAAAKGAAAAESALREMEYLGIYGPVSLPALLERYPRHKGTPIVRVCLERLADDPGGRIRSDLEEALPALPRCPSDPSAAPERLALDRRRPLPGRLPLARREAHRRARRLQVPRHEASLPQGPQAGSATRGSRVPRGSHHGRPALGRTAGARRRSPRPHLQPSVITYAPRWP